MKTNCLILLFLLLFIGTIPIFSQTLTLQEAIDSAIVNNNDLKSQSIALESKKRSNDNLWNAYMPSPSLSASLRNSHSSSRTDWSWGLSAGLSFSLNAAIPINVQITALDYEIAKNTYGQLYSSIKTSVASSFYSLLMSQENLKILESSRNLSEQAYNQVNINYKNGLASELDLLKAQYSWQSTLPQLTQAESTYKTNLASFLLLIGLNPETDRIPQGEIQLKELKLPDTNTLISEYVSGRYDIILKEQNLKRAELTYDASKRKTFIPSINTGETLSFNGTELSGTFSLSLSVPIMGFIPGTSENLALKNSEDSIETARLALENTQKNARQDIISKTEAISRLWQSLDVTNFNQRIAERTYELSTEGYESGLVSQTDLENTRQQMISAQQSVLQAEINYINGVYSLANSLNISIDELYQKY